MKVDVHAHCYPKPYIEELKRIGAGQEGGIGIQIPEWSSSEERIEEMDKLGIDIQVLSLSAPLVYFQDAELSKDLAQMTNDFISDVCRKDPDRFMCFASIPLNNMKYAFDELDRAINRLGMDGVILGTNINQRPLSEDQFLPFLEELDKRKMPIYLHPMKAIGEDFMPAEYLKLRIPSLIGFLFETTSTVAQLTFKGTFEKYKHLAFILPHSGGAIPFVYPRWDLTYLKTLPSSHPLRKVPNVPSYYLKKHYYDIALAFYHSSLKCTIDLASIDHVLFGTDFPYTIDSRAGDSIEKIESFGFSNEEKEKIYFKNAITLFPKIKEILSHKSGTLR